MGFEKFQFKKCIQVSLSYSEPIYVLSTMKLNQYLLNSLRKLFVIFWKQPGLLSD